MGGHRVLVVDDEVDFAAYVGEASRRLGLEVRLCHSCAEAKQGLTEFLPHLIVLDIVMPGEDGIEFLQWHGKQAHRAALVLVTGFNPKYAEMASELGRIAGIEVAALVTKPVRMKALQETLRKHLPSEADEA